MTTMKCLFFVMLSIFLSGESFAAATPPKKLEKPPLSERWFGIYVDKERVGFYRQTISEVPQGYLLEGDGSVRMKVMGYSKEATTREVYLTGKNLALRSLEVEQKLNGTISRITGKVHDSSLRIKNESNGKAQEKTLKFRGDIYPGPALNLYPLLKEALAGKTYKVLTFDPEEIKIKEVKISVVGEDKTPDGQPALKLRNNLYPFVSNDIWVDSQGNTLLESVREGLVVTRAEEPRQLAGFVSDVALSGKDLIYDFSLIRAEPPIKESHKLKGLEVEISGWNDSLPLLQEGGQVMEKSGNGRISMKTGSLLPTKSEERKPGQKEVKSNYLQPAEKIESDAPEIVGKAKEIAADTKSPEETARALATWTSEWLKDTVDDSGGALNSLKSRHGNCQTHARLYTALARAAGIPTRFVSGLVYLEGKGFLYHSWAESMLSGRWTAVDPTSNQLPADPTHLKFFEGHTQEDMAPIIAIIGRISIKVLDTKY
ncbi:transglutaminase-like domain-containing protein [Pelotalea chapellei]|nr:transglutaminase-like domain-containing protein [Pelotalea chapellei]